MKIVHCRECQQEVERHDRVCPHCRAEIPGESAFILTTKYSLFFVILSGIMYGLFNVGA